LLYLQGGLYSMRLMTINIHQNSSQWKQCNVRCIGMHIGGMKRKVQHQHAATAVGSHG